MVKYCQNCGEELDEDSVFCMACGNRIDGKSKSSSAKENINNSFNKFSESVNESFDSFQNLFDIYKISMMEGEKVIKHSQIHINCLILPIAIVFICLLNLLLSDNFFSGFIAFLIFLVSIVYLIIRYVGYKNTDLILTNKRIFGKLGLVSTTQMQSPLNMINSVSFSNGLFGKIFGYGTVQVVTASTMYKFRFIRDGQVLYSDIFNQLERSEKEKLQEQAEAIAEALSKRA